MKFTTLDYCALFSCENRLFCSGTKFRVNSVFGLKPRGHKLKDSSGELSAFITTGFQRALVPTLFGTAPKTHLLGTYLLFSDLIPGVGNSLFLTNVMTNITCQLESLLMKISVSTRNKTLKFQSCYSL